MAILGGSYFILYNINPQLTNLKVPGLEKFEIPALEGTISTPAEATPAGRIKEISKKIKELVEDIFKSATSLRQSTGRCDCRYTIPQCDCIGLMCAGIQCYGDPCPERENIEKMQRELVNQIEELLFYKRWIESEREDMAAELQAAEEEGYITQEEISSLLSQIDILMVQIDGTAQAELLDPEKEEMGERTGTAGMKELVEKLLSMPEQCTSGWCAPGCIENAGSEISDSEAKLSYKIASLSYSFLLAQCSGGVCPVPGEEEEEEEEEEEGGEGGGGKEDTGCHDGTGCHPSACDIGDYCPKIFEQFIGSNPCPQNPIIDKVDEIEGLKNKIQETCNKIIAILE